MKDLLERVLKQLPGCLPDLASLVTGLKTAIMRWIREATGDLSDVQLVQDVLHQLEKHSVDHSAHQPTSLPPLRGASARLSSIVGIRVGAPRDSAPGGRIRAEARRCP